MTEKLNTYFAQWLGVVTLIIIADVCIYLLQSFQVGLVNKGSAGWCWAECWGSWKQGYGETVEKHRIISLFMP